MYKVSNTNRPLVYLLWVVGQGLQEDTNAPLGHKISCPAFVYFHPHSMKWSGNPSSTLVFESLMSTKKVILKVSEKYTYETKHTKTG
jgi:hypothetical protein